MVYRLDASRELGSIVVGSRRLCAGIQHHSIDQRVWPRPSGRRGPLRRESARTQSSTDPRRPAGVARRGDICDQNPSGPHAAISCDCARGDAAAACGHTCRSGGADRDGDHGVDDREAAEKLQCGKGRVRAMLRDGRLTHISVGHRVFVLAPDVMLLVAAASAAQ